jgi:hypothetical protein
VYTATNKKDFMETHRPWSQILVIVGAVAMLVGALDPMEGSVVILTGSGLVALGTFLGNTSRRLRVYWTWTFLLIAFGVGVMFGASAIGGFGGTTGRSTWWAVLVLPYPVGWVMGVVNLFFRFRRRRG